MTNGTLTVGLYGGPGTGKSTTAALVFGALKQLGRNVEFVPEYAKDLTWERAHGKLAFQPYVIGKQMWRLERLRGQVDAIITDTSTLLGLMYATEVPNEFRDWVVADYKAHPTYNVFLSRDELRPYNPAGRSQTRSEAEGFDLRIKDLLDDLSIPYDVLRVNKDDNRHVDAIVEQVCQRL